MDHYRRESKTHFTEKMYKDLLVYEGHVIVNIIM